MRVLMDFTNFCGIPLASAFLVETGIPCFFLLGQALDINPGITQLVSNGMTIVVLAWYVIYDVKTRTPVMINNFREEQKAIRQAYSDESSANRLENRQIIEGMRSMFLQEQAALRLAFATEQQVSRAQHDKDRADLQEMLFNNMNAMRQAVHDVKDTAQVAMNHQSLNRLKKSQVADEAQPPQ